MAIGCARLTGHSVLQIGSVQTENGARDINVLNKRTILNRGGSMDDITITVDEAETLICFIKNHEREDIPDSVWDVCMKLYDLLYD